MKQYILLTKPGIIFGNLITAIAGFCLAMQKGGSFGLFLASMSGLALIIASACVLNNYFDRDIDGLMNRTKRRPFVAGELSIVKGLSFALLLLIVGVYILAKYTTLCALLAALSGFFVYVVLYGIAKRKTHHATLIGSVAGAVPPVVGYTSVTGSLDIPALLLFFIVLCWQLPHFFAIALYRLEEYQAASIPVLPAVYGISVTKTYMLVSIFAFIIATISLWVVHGMSSWYLATSGVLGGAWIWLCNCQMRDWARKMFFYSLVVIMILCIVISIDAVHRRL